MIMMRKRKNNRNKMSEYCSTTENGKTILVHKKIWAAKFGEVPKGSVIHHKNFNKKDNRIENLCLLSKSEHTLVHKRGNVEVTGG